MSLKGAQSHRKPVKANPAWKQAHNRLLEAMKGERFAKQHACHESWWIESARTDAPRSEFMLAVERRWLN